MAGARPLLQAGSRLPQRTLEVTRVADANRAQPSGSALSSVAFHPSGQLLLTASLDRRLHFFQVRTRMSAPVLRRAVTYGQARRASHAQAAALTHRQGEGVTAGSGCAQVDGLHNERLQTVVLDDLPIWQASFTPDGSQARPCPAL